MEKIMADIKWKYGGSVSEKDICSVESALGVTLPTDYRIFVADHNGARPKPKAIDIPGKREGVMERLVHLDSGTSDNVSSAATALRSRGQGGLVPFASDPFGNLFCFQFSGNSVIAVVFWDHETNSTSRICNTFSELVGLLRPPYP
jgi:cell wall assembly regulator SMI1